MKHYKAVGISAPQIGIPLRIIMVEIPEYMVEHFGPEACKTREIVQTPFKVGSLEKF
jgi:peptide deformylase